MRNWVCLFVIFAKIFINTSQLQAKANLYDKELQRTYRETDIILCLLYNTFESQAISLTVEGHHYPVTGLLKSDDIDIHHT